MFPSNKSSTCLFMMTISFTGKLRLLVASSAPWWRLEALTAPFCPFKLGAEKTRLKQRKRNLKDVQYPRSWSVGDPHSWRITKLLLLLSKVLRKKANGLEMTPLCFKGISERNNMSNQKSSIMFCWWHAWPFVRPLELAIFFSAHLPRAPRSTHNRGNVFEWVETDIKKSNSLSEHDWIVGNPWILLVTVFRTFKSKIQRLPASRSRSGGLLGFLTPASIHSQNVTPLTSETRWRGEWTPPPPKKKKKKKKKQKKKSALYGAIVCHALNR